MKKQPTHFRAHRINEFYNRLRTRLETLLEQKEDPAFQDMREILTGEAKALSLVIREMEEEFQCSPEKEE